jgi:UDP-N-acetylmuramoyl-tripeptide--D-alanyl-D-alanine ligase
MTLFASLLLLAAYAFFAARRLLRYLHIFQQEEYKPLPFLGWIVKTASFDKRLSAALVLAALASFYLQNAVEEGLLISAIFVLFAVLESDPRKTAKKKLAMTQRAQRIFVLAAIVSLGVGVAGLALGTPWFWIFAVQFIPVSLAVANVLLMPVEATIQSRIRNEASTILAQTNPRIIGITGSFGKTSVKHILGHILEMNATTLFTPGSVNTLMGISRIIRENLKPDTRYFIVEMGAYGKGSIEKLCKLTPPSIGIITALGEAHYERFKTLDTVARAKFELAEAVLQAGNGKVIIHESVLEQPYAREFVQKNRSRFFICGGGPDADLIIGNAVETAAGLTVPVSFKDETRQLFAPLHGSAHANNIAVAFAAAIISGVPSDRAAAALRTVPQIKHRLEMIPQMDGTTYIDDAYNSNPKGFAAALDFLAMVGAEKGARRILITPGIVELGEKNDEIHRALGQKAATCADILFVVRPDRIPSLAEGFKACAPEKEVHVVQSFKEAQQWLIANAKAPDVILVENDLLDLDEIKLAL